jgi:hypothetical protein
VIHLAGWPETLKAIAGAVTAVVGAITAVGGLIAVATKKGREFIARGMKAIRGSRRSRADLRIVASDRATFWSPGTLGDEQVMLFHGTFFVTNLNEFDVCLLKFRLRQFQTEHHMMWAAERDRDGRSMVRVAEGRVLPAGQLFQAEIDCIARGVARERLHPIVADVIFTDNLARQQLPCCGKLRGLLVGVRHPALAVRRSAAGSCPIL